MCGGIGDGILARAPIRPNSAWKRVKCPLRALFLQFRAGFCMVGAGFCMVFYGCAKPSDSQRLKSSVSAENGGASTVTLPRAAGRPSRRTGQGMEPRARRGISGAIPPPATGAYIWHAPSPPYAFEAARAHAAEGQPRYRAGHSRRSGGGFRADRGRRSVQPFLTRVSRHTVGIGEGINQADRVTPVFVFNVYQFAARSMPPVDGRSERGLWTGARRLPGY